MFPITIGLPESQSKDTEDDQIECSQYNTGGEPLLDTLVPGLLQLLSIPTNKVHVRWTVVCIYATTPATEDSRESLFSMVARYMEGTHTHTQSITASGIKSYFVYV